ncbi:MAG: 2-oxoacid:acceptor oxidoreductase family protein [Candidatus Bathyarchaeota archaeon]|nr:MAG: 2-oxoacid:acceptor oxidoreductase family protein [Candidatus Bathyarchaeota archaeon]
MVKRIEIRISGLGGQGVLLAGQIYGKAAAFDRKHVVQTQSYGAEARGSAARSEVIISNARIGFPTVRKCDILVAMGGEAMNRNLKDLKGGGVLIIDSSKIKKVPPVNVKILKIPATETAIHLFKDKIYANIIMLGALANVAGEVEIEVVEEAIKDSVPKETLKTNIQAFKEGLKLSGF